METLGIRNKARLPISALQEKPLPMRASTTFADTEFPVAFITGDPTVDASRVLHGGPQWHLAQRKAMTSTSASGLPTEDPCKLQSKLVKEGGREERREQRGRRANGKFGKEMRRLSDLS